MNVGKNQQVFVGIDVNCVVRTVDLGATVMVAPKSVKIHLHGFILHINYDKCMYFVRRFPRDGLEALTAVVSTVG